MWLNLGLQRHQAGGEKPTKQASHLQSEVMQESVPELDFYSAKEEWVQKAGGKPKTTEFVCSEAEVQNGRNICGQRPTATKQLDDIHQPTRCPSVSQYVQGAQKVPEVQVGGQIRIPVLCSAPRIFTKLLKPVIALPR